MRNSRQSIGINKKSMMKIILVILIAAIIGYVGSNGIIVGTGTYQYKIKPIGDVINKGLDLVGGVSVLEEAVGDANNVVNNDSINRTILMLDKRLNKLGVSETTVTQEGKTRIRIEVPGKFDANEVIKSIGKTGKLVFKDPTGAVILSGADNDIKNATSGTSSDTGQPEVDLEFTDQGAKKFAEATTKLVGQKIAIYMDEDLLTNPNVNSAILNGRAVITGSNTIEEAKNLADIIKSGALPLSLKVVESKTVDSTLGKSALPSSVKAGFIGFCLVSVFMIVLYRRPGFLACISLSIYIMLVLAVFLTIKVTLTLAGIAGLLLTVGMALDANVLIFERVKEELKTGKSVKTSVEVGFSKALSSVYDSNITTIIGGVVLYMVGTGSVKGFALTLVVGILVSLFTALTVTQNLLRWSVDIGFVKKRSHFGVKGE